MMIINNRNMHFTGYKTALLTLVVAFLFPLRAGGQPTVVHGYEFTTGVDSSLWVDMSNAVSWNFTGEMCYELPFPFFWGDSYRKVQVFRDGTVLFVRHAMVSNLLPYIYFPSRLSAFDSNMDGGIYAWRNVCMGIADLPYMQTLEFDSGSCPPGQRMAVIQLGSFVNNGLVNRFQIRFRESDGSLTLVYGPQATQPNVFSEVGVALDAQHVICVNPSSHTASAAQPALQHVWPGAYRYYRFIPSDSLCCPDAPSDLCAEEMGLYGASGVRLRWHGCMLAAYYEVEYGSEGFAEGEGTRITVADTEVVIHGLMDGEVYEMRVRSVCPFSETGWSSMTVGTSCSGRLHYDRLYADSVKCCTGTFHSPSGAGSPRNVVDFGSASIFSRHTVHKDVSERDVRTRNLLRTVPEGYCSSVRLGNWQDGGEQESITYTLAVDTNQFDLLVLRYAVVEQNPNHLPEDQPRFTFEITDTAGVRISNCYYGNFVSGDLSGWNIGEINVVWRDWEAVGVDLTPLHGQTINVTLSNYDCALGGHYGYAYFVLEAVDKHIFVESCGDVVSSMLYAPEGFSYRWYSMDDTTATLSTSRSCLATSPGVYKCHMTYQLSGQECGFTSSAFVGGRFPAAAFTMQQLDSCGSTVHFDNQSAVALDSNLTQLTAYPCDEYRWDFGDGTSSSTPSPTHIFGEGTFRVTLYAMLGGGECVDSASQTVTVALGHDTVYASICEGEEYDFFGRRLTREGEYKHQDSCLLTTLMLRVNPVYATEVLDSFAAGGSFWLDGEMYDEAGVYTRNLVSTMGCDSLVTLRLSCVTRIDTVVCSSSLPVVWRGVLFEGEGSDTLRHRVDEGSDSVWVFALRVLEKPELSVEAEPFCHLPGGYSIMLPDSLCYRFTASPADSALPLGWVRGTEVEWPLLLTPRSPTRYCLEAERCDTIHCSWSDTLLLNPIETAVAEISVSPRLLDLEHLELTVSDVTAMAHERSWFLNGTLWPEGDSVLTYRASFTDDSVAVMLVASTPDCSDTARDVVPVRVQSLWFPNVFTPDFPTNNRFRGYGMNVKDYDLQVFTRWGDCIFHTKNLEEGWDGTYRGVKSPESAYAYLCHYTTLEGKPEVMAGTVTLVR